MGELVIALPDAVPFVAGGGRRARSGVMRRVRRRGSRAGRGSRRAARRSRRPRGAGRRAASGPGCPPRARAEHVEHARAAGSWSRWPPAPRPGAEGLLQERHVEPPRPADGPRRLSGVQGRSLHHLGVEGEPDRDDLAVPRQAADRPVEEMASFLVGRRSRPRGQGGEGPAERPGAPSARGRGRRGRRRRSSGPRPGGCPGTALSSFLNRANITNAYSYFSSSFSTFLAFGGGASLFGSGSHQRTAFRECLQVQFEKHLSRAGGGRRWPARFTAAIRNVVEAGT